MKLSSGALIIRFSGWAPISVASAGCHIIAMEPILTRIDVERLRKELQRARVATTAAIELGDCHAVAHLTCEAARLQSAIRLARTVHLERA
jgi:hypothetical protein